MSDAAHNIRMPFFPVPAPGETVFSVVGRCIERLGIANQHLLPILTGQRLSTTLFSALPGYLGKISRAMPYGHPWSNIHELLRNHTALPYFTYFHTEDQRITSAEQLAATDNTQPLMLGLGLSTYRVPVPPSSVRFCESCLKEQCRQPGHSYFQVVHQLPGITHCWKHKELLSDGCITCGHYPLKGKKLTMPGQCLCKSFAASKLEHALASADSAYWLARESEYLLNAADTSFDRRSRLREGVLRAGFCRGSLVDYDLLANAIELRFGIEFLQSINHPARDPGGRPSAWIRRRLPNKPNDKRLPTIVGLLILGAAFDSVEAFEHNCISDNLHSLETKTSPTPVASTPHWASGLRELLIKHGHRISTCAGHLQLSSWKVAIEARNQGISIPLSPAAIARIGKDRLDKTRELLRQGVEKDQILRTQEISAWTLQLIELDDLNLSILHRNATETNRRDLHRKRIQEYLKDHPSATRQTISNDLAGAYDFMLGKDREWFFENVPQASRTSVRERPQRNDWSAIDKSLAEAVQKTATDMKNSEERPIRVTKSMLLGHHRALKKYHAEPERFPITTTTLEQLSETTDQFLERKVTWGVRRLISSGMEISMDTLRRETAISDIRLKLHSSMVRRVLLEQCARVSEKSILQSIIEP